MIPLATARIRSRSNRSGRCTCQIVEAGNLREDRPGNEQGHGRRNLEGRWVQAREHRCVNLARRARAALHSANPQAIMLTEQPALVRQFEYKDGSFDDGIHNFVTRWLWDAQGSTDTITTSFSLDEWNQILAIGAKLACLGQFLDPPPGASADEFIEASLKKVRPDRPWLVPGVALASFWGLHQWRNSGLILGLRREGNEDGEGNEDAIGLRDTTRISTHGSPILAASSFPSPSPLRHHRPRLARTVQGVPGSR